MRKLLMYSILSVVICTGCGGKAQSQEDTEIGLVSCELKADVSAESVRFTLIISNDTDGRAVLQFPTSQQYDFVVRDDKGEIVWQWSKGMMFAQMLTALSMDPGEIKEFIEEHSFQEGEYSVQGIIPSTPVKIQTKWVDFIVEETQTKQFKGRITKILEKLYLLGEDGTAYLIENPSSDLINLQGKEIEVKSYKAYPIPGTIDKKIEITDYIAD